jgi:hypothetical protein
MANQAVQDSVATCKSYADSLRQIAQAETDNEVKKLLFEAAHHLDVSIAELDYIVTDATIPI